MSLTKTPIPTLADRLAGRTRLSLAEFGELMGWGQAAVKSRADRGLLGVPVHRYSGPNSARYVLVSEVLAAFSRGKSATS